MKSIYEKLLALQKNSYCVYSNYPVASIVIASDDKQYEGVNVENSAFGLTVCAERNAIGSAIANGNKKIKTVHLICGKDKKTFGIPCGACCQVISEFIEEDGKIYLWNSEGKYQEYTIKDFMPKIFSKEFFDKE